MPSAGMPAGFRPWLAYMTAEGTPAGGSAHGYKARVAADVLVAAARAVRRVESTQQIPALQAKGGDGDGFAYRCH